MNKILITTSSFGLHDTTSIHRLKNSGFEVVFNPYGRKLTEDEVLSLIKTHNPVGMVAGVEPLTSNVLRKASGLKVISRCGIGLDSVDIEAAASMGIVVTNTPDAPTIPVAELTMGLILSLLRQIHNADSSIREGKWYRPTGGLLFGKTVGIIGCGRIGSYLAGLLSSFKCKILGYDAYKHNDSSNACNRLDPDLSNLHYKSSLCYQPSELPQLLLESDIITLHIPYTSENHHFINNDRIKLMKKGAYLINASRGGLVDEEALYQNLKSGHLSGAAIDSFEKEPYLGNLKYLENVLLTSHIGSYALEGRIIMENQSVDNLLKILDI
ncbi:MAG: phosphoglycerate dehydrogenase [Desulfamplus sp.]|nr:phosphoglycerate dehydrogenase [Desulfamplus sp.]